MSVTVPRTEAPRVRRRGRVLLVAAVASWVVAVGVQIASAGVARPEPLVVATVLLLTVAAWGFAARYAGLAAASRALVTAAALGFVAEWVGTTTGLPFGAYTYTGVLDPHLATVPLVVPLAWFAMGVPAYAIAAAVVSASRLTGAAAVVGRAVIGALALTAWDLFLDPQMVGLGYWEWADPGPYRGIPLGNYAGWLAVSFVLMLVLSRLLAPKVPDGERMRGLLGLYTSMAVVETVGFLGPLQLDPVVALCGGVGMGSVTVLAWVAVRRG